MAARTPRYACSNARCQIPRGRRDGGFAGQHDFWHSRLGRARYGRGVLRLWAMARFFNTTGPCDPERHYFLPPESRLRKAQLDRYVRDQLYWVLHAPRQTGKTTVLMTWMRELNASAQAIACYVSVERCQGLPEIERALPAVCEAIRQYASDVGVPVPEYPPRETSPSSLLAGIARRWSELCAPKPLVVLFDEVDTLEGPALVSFLRQLRGGFASRGKVPRERGLGGHAGSAGLSHPEQGRRSAQSGQSLQHQTLKEFQVFWRENSEVWETKAGTTPRPFRTSC